MYAEKFVEFPSPYRWDQILRLFLHRLSILIEKYVHALNIDDSHDIIDQANLKLWIFMGISSHRRPNFD